MVAEVVMVELGGEEGDQTKLDGNQTIQLKLYKLN